MYRLLVYILTFFTVSSLYGQKVIVSPEISLRNKLAYDLVGNVNGDILFYTEKSRERHVAIYDQDLVFQSERQIHLDEDRVSVYEVINQDSAFAIVYSYQDENEEVYKLDRFSEAAHRIDSIELIRKENRLFRNIESILSEDESTLALYNIASRDELYVITIDLSTGKVIHDQQYNIAPFDLYDELEQLALADDGSLYLLFQKNNYKNRRKQHIANIYRLIPGKEIIQEITIPMTNLLCQDVYLKVNNQNGHIGIAGLFDEKRANESSGYFWIQGDYNGLANTRLEFFPFPKNILLEIDRGKRHQKIEALSISEVFWKLDNTPILVCEIAYDVIRQVNANAINSTNFGSGGRRLGSGGWSDHYREDMILISLDRNHDIEWTQVLYKKQFSQNDNGVFSSFFPFVTPSRLRLIYNDEIKNNSTVSEYILDTEGNYKRTSVLSTEYQNLRLRFADAIQISPTSLLIPSEKNYEVNIVKIDFES